MTLYVNNEKIEENQIQVEIERLRPQYEQAFADQTPDQQKKQLYEWSRENVIEQVLLRQAAIAAPEEIPSEAIETEYQKLLDEHGGKENFYQQFGGSEQENSEQVKKEIFLRLRLERLIKEIHSKTPMPTEEDARSYFQENQDQFQKPEMVRASHIVKHFSPEAAPDKLREQLEQLIKQIQNPDEFAQMARQHSDCPDNNGDLGFFPRGEMVEKFEEMVFSMEIGQISGVFHTEMGYHIAMVTDKKPTGPCSFDEVSDKILEELTQQSQQKAIEQFVDQRKAQTAIEDK